ncbi:hypothetical protein ES708_32634 [subsurface metagenome]
MLVRIFLKLAKYNNYLHFLHQANNYLFKNYKLKGFSLLINFNFYKISDIFRIIIFDKKHLFFKKKEDF